MTEYISKAEAINTILGNMQNGESNMEEIFNTALRKAASRIETIPAADVVPVVRCRECKWGKKTSKEGIFYHCGYPYDKTGKVHLPNWYCPGGARKEKQT